MFLPGELFKKLLLLLLGRNNVILHHYRLTLGLMGLDELHLRVLATSSEDLREKRNAQKGKFVW